MLKSMGRFLLAVMFVLVAYVIQAVLILICLAIGPLFTSSLFTLTPAGEVIEWLLIIGFGLIWPIVVAVKTWKDQGQSEKDAQEWNRQYRWVDDGVNPGKWVSRNPPYDDL